jgi:uncharacterized protein YjiS (DUF1127 family)
MRPRKKSSSGREIYSFAGAAPKRLPWTQTEEVSMAAPRENFRTDAIRLRRIAIRAFRRWLGQRIIRFLGLPGVWIDRSRNRAEMGRLDDRMLRDAGLSRLDVERELRKPFWRD